MFFVLLLYVAPRRRHIRSWFSTTKIKINRAVKFNSDSALLLKALHVFLRVCVQQFWFLRARNEILFARALNTQSCAASATNSTTLQWPCPQLPFQFRVMQQTFERRDSLRISPTLLTHRRRAVALQNFILQPYWNAQHMLPIQFTLCVMNSKHQNTKGLKKSGPWLCCWGLTDSERTFILKHVQGLNEWGLSCLNTLHYFFFTKN